MFATHKRSWRSLTLFGVSLGFGALGLWAGGTPHLPGLQVPVVWTAIVLALLPAFAAVAAPTARLVRTPGRSLADLVVDLRADPFAGMVAASFRVGLVICLVSAALLPGAHLVHSLGGRALEAPVAGGASGTLPVGAFFNYLAGFWAAFLCAGINYRRLFLRYQLATRRSPALAAVLSYAAAGLLGTWLLTLPFFQRDLLQASLFNAFFISFSALTTTGLANVEITTQWNVAGQFVLLLLMLVGGLGIFVLWAVITAAARRFGLAAAGRHTVELGDAEFVKDRELLQFFVRTGAFFAGSIGLGAVLLAVADRHSSGLGERIFHALFHATSAFCNAGFALTPTTGSIGGSYLYGGVMSLLVLLGGVGPAVVLFPRTPHARAALRATAVLVVGGAAVLWLFDLANPGNDLLLSLYQSVAARTAGFGWLDIGTLPEVAVVGLMALMFIGACPGGTGGGVKATMFHALRRAFVAMGRSSELDDKTLRESAVESMEAFVVVGFFAVLVLAGFFALAALESAPSVSLLFEVVSAVSTTGLSRNLTPQLGPASLLVLVPLMVAGKIGPVLLLQAIFRSKLDADDFLERIEAGRVLTV